MILPIAILLLCQLIGETLARGLALPLPGPVLGMAILLIGCMSIPRLSQIVMPVSQGILKHLSLLFVPAGVGVITHLDVLGGLAPALLMVILASTAMALVASVLTFVIVARLCGDDSSAAPGEPQA